MRVGALTLGAGGGGGGRETGRLQDYVAELARIDGNHFMCEYDDFKVRRLGPPTQTGREVEPVEPCGR